MNDAAIPLVSVVIPTYNHGCYLGRALQSVLDQTYTNWEAIVVDNNSTDNTDEVMAGFNDPRFTYLKIHNNGVIAASRNAGIRVARGGWVAFLDSDDWWKKDKLKVCFDRINDEVDLVYHDLEIVREAPSILKRRYLNSWQVKKPVLKDLLLRGNAIATTSVVVRKSLLEKIGGINESVKMIAVEDFNTWLRIAQITDKFIYLHQCLGFYLFHTGGVSRKKIDELLYHACSEFMYLLDSQEAVTYEATVQYVIALNDFYSGKASSARSGLYYSIRHGNLSLKLKSIILLCYFRLKF